MKPFANANARDVRHALALIRDARAQGRTPAIVGGGSDLLGMAKDHLIAPDVLVNLKSIGGLDRIEARSGEVAIGSQITLDVLSRDPLVRRQFTVLAEAAESVGTPQIRNVGTLAGNICQRPWCWYFRNGFPCLKNGGGTCFAAGGENQFHAIFGGGPSHIVHPSDTAPALVALGANFHIAGPGGDRIVAASDFFTLPRIDPKRENVLAGDEILTSVTLPRPAPNVRSTYQKVMDREAWTHALVGAAVMLELDRQTCKAARIVLGGVAPVPWRVPEVEALLAGQRLTPELAARAGEMAVKDARPLAKNGYKVPLTRNLVRRALLDLVSRS